MSGGGAEEGSSSGTLSPFSISLGGTGADNAADARTNLGITPANIGAVATSDIVDNVTTNDGTKVLSAKQGKVLQDKIGSTDISSLGSTLTEAISAVNDNIQQSTAFVPSTGNAGFHNSLYRGKYLGNTFTAEQDAAIRAGTFDGMFVGDYWTINGVDWVIVGFDIRFNIGDTALTTHHIGVMPRASLYSTQWHTSNDTSMGYVGSAIRANIKASGGAQEKFIAAFGSANVLSFRELYPTTYSGGNATGWAWVDARTELLSEVDVYGCPVWSVGGKGYEVGADKSQLPIFRLRPDFANTRAGWWLRSVFSATYAARVSYDGAANNRGASDTDGVRPLSLIA